MFPDLVKGLVLPETEKTGIALKAFSEFAVLAVIDVYLYMRLTSRMHTWDYTTFW